MCWGPTPSTFPYTSPIPLPTSFPHTPMRFLSPYTFPHPSPLTPYTLPHFSTPHTSFLTSPYTPYTSSHSYPDLPLHPNTLPHSPHALSSPLPHSFDYVAKLPCDDVTLINLTGLWKSSIKFFTTTGNLKNCFGVGNVNFRCMKVWRIYCGEVTGNRLLSCRHGFDSESGQTNDFKNWYSQLPCLTLSIKETVWRTSWQVYLLCRWERHLAGLPHLSVVDKWLATPKRARIAH